LNAGTRSAFQAQAVSLAARLDRYAAGEFDAALADLRTPADFEALPKQFEQQAAAWIDAGDAADRARRQLAAATFALEAARADEWRDWKRTLIATPFGVMVGSREPRPDVFLPLGTLAWGPAPRLIEWGCKLLRADATPRPIERIWQLAALGVALRSEDPQFLVGDPRRGLGAGSGEIMNDQDEIKHLDHVEARFPQEARYKLAQGIARFRDWPDDARRAFAALADHPEAGAEATMRDGQMLIASKPDEALAKFARAEQQSRDPYVQHLAAYLRGVTLERTKQPAALAEAAYRRALRSSPGAQSASIALAALLVRQDKVGEARQLSLDMLRTDPPPPDPWREFIHADDRFWPGLIARLRREIHK